MLRIGDFAGITGLSVKALRHYDDMAVLPPDEVDARSGYRLYAEHQVRRGVIVRALRSAGVPLPLLRSVHDEASALETLEAHRTSVLEARLREDEAHSAAITELRAMAAPVRAEARDLPRQLFVRRQLTAPATDSDPATDEAANNAFAELYGRLNRAGAALTGRFWTAMRATEAGGVAIDGCWEVLSPPEPSCLGPEDAFGAMPERCDLVVTWQPTSGEELPEGTTHPAVIALFDVLAEHSIEFQGLETELRQTMLDPSSADSAIEVSVTLPTH